MRVAWVLGLCMWCGIVAWGQAPGFPTGGYDFGGGPHHSMGLNLGSDHTFEWRVAEQSMDSNSQTVRGTWTEGATQDDGSWTGTFTVSNLAWGGYRPSTEPITDLNFLGLRVHNGDKVDFTLARQEDGKYKFMVSDLKHHAAYAQLATHQ